MADNPLQPNKPGKKELSMEQRLLLAFVLMGLVLFLTPYFYKAPPPPPKTSSARQLARPPRQVRRRRRFRKRLRRRPRRRTGRSSDARTGTDRGQHRAADCHRHRHLSRDAFQSRRYGPQLDPEEIPRQARQAPGIGERRQLFQSGAAVFHRPAGRQGRRRVELRPLRG